MKYIVLYLDEETFEETEERVRKLYFVRNIECSYRPDIKMNFADRVGSKAVLREEGFGIEELDTEIRLAEHL